MIILCFNIDFQVRVNIPNGDMVGHTGDIEATVVACEAADLAVKVCFISLLTSLNDDMCECVT